VNPKGEPSGIRQDRLPEAYHFNQAPRCQRVATATPSFARARRRQRPQLVEVTPDKRSLVLQDGRISATPRVQILDDRAFLKIPRSEH